VRNFLTFAKAKIKAGPLTVISNKIPELKSLGLKEMHKKQSVDGQSD
jgi:hypothetical protein